MLTGFQNIPKIPELNGLDDRIAADHRRHGCRRFDGERPQVVRRDALLVRG